MLTHTLKLHQLIFLTFVALPVTTAHSIGMAVGLQERVIKYIGFELEKADLTSKVLLGCPDSALCVPIATANSYELSRRQSLCEKLFRIPKTNSIEQILPLAQALEPNVTTIGMPTGKAINILKELDPELVKRLSLRPLSFARRVDETYKEHLLRIHQALKTSI